MKKTLGIYFLLLFAMIAIVSVEFLIKGFPEMQNENTFEKNNMILIPVENDPTISLRICFMAGSAKDPKGKEGLAMLTAEMIADGSTKINDYEDILEKLYPIASLYEAKTDMEVSVISGRTHHDNIELFSGLFCDAITKPAFTKSDFERIKSDMLNYLENDLLYSDDEELAKACLYNSVFEGTGYGHISEGTIAGLKNITLADVKEFYKKYYTSKDVIIGLAGGYDSSLVENIKSRMLALPPVTREGMQKPHCKSIEGHEYVLIEKDCDATAISFGFPIPVLRSDEDFFALALFNSWFGEHRNSSSHLYQVIREKRGLNYGDYSYIEAFLDGGSLEMPEPNNPRTQQIFEVWIRPVPNEARLFALRAALRELKKVVDMGISQEDFENTKKFLNKYALYFAQTTMEKLGYQIDSRIYGVNDGGDYIDYFRRKINNLKLEDVNTAIKKYIQYDNIKFAIVTKGAEEMKNSLVNNELSTIEYKSPKPQEVLNEDKEILAFDLKVNPKNITIFEIDELFLK